jgi:hypothetical protein
MSGSMPDQDHERSLITIGHGRSLWRSPWRLAVVGAALVIIVTIIVVLATTQTAPKLAVPREAFNILTQRFWAVLGFAVGIGVASAAAIQLAKQLFRVRSRFQRRWVMDWIGERCAIEPLWADWLERHRAIERTLSAPPDAAPVLASALAASQRKLAAEELQEALLGGRTKRALRDVFDLPIEQLCAQISSAADLAIAEPDRNAELLLGLMGPTGLKDIDSLAPPRRIVDGRIERIEPARSKKADAYPPVAQGVRTGIDVMQISVGQRWRRGVQSSAVLISGILGVIGVFFARVTWPTRGLFILAALVFGGFFAWLVRDLTAIIERIRG